MTVYGLDFHGRVSSSMSRILLKELAPIGRCSSRSPCCPSTLTCTLKHPGLGVEIDHERVVAAANSNVDWHNPIWRHPDGSIAEW